MDTNAIIEGAVKFRDGKKWKTRWCVMTKISPVADCLHLQLYRDCKDRYKQGQTKASLSLQHFLGLESGFTLDKESNTVAIICQDLTVVLAFDTRERLIQWQVKIGTHLGEDQQFLIQISSAPTKSKVPTGPARLHIQDYKFCLTAGVPPRLLGVWEIGHLRRYGVVDGKFCFEGGSRCGSRGEGLHVLGCGQASEVQQAMQLASQGRLATRRRPIARKMSAMDSPRKTMHSRTDPRASDLSCADSLLGAESLLGRSLCEAAQHHGSATMEDLTGGRRSPWSSAESSEMLDSCSDVTSVVAAGDLESERRPGSMERCASCISKLGAVSVKGSSAFSPAWTMEQHSQSASLAQDRASLSSGSSGGSSAADWYDRPRAVHAVPPTVPPKSPRHVPRCQCCPPERPPKPPSPKKAAPCQRAIPGHAQPLQPPSQQQVEEHNYDVPRSFLHARMPLQERHSSLDYYDTPKKFREAIEYSNYDTPPMAKSVRQPCGCSTLPSPRRPDNSPQRDIRRDCLERPPHLRKEAPRAHCAESSLDDCTGMPYVWRGDKRGLQVAARMASDVAGGSCPCQRVMCWSLPCRRGSGAEDTGIPIHKVRLNGEGRMPVRDPSGQLAVLYATVDKTKKKPRPLPSPNYVNIGEMSTPQANYANMDFAQSLENYENARDILQRAGITKESLDLCHKCGHAPEQYLMMEPRKPMFPGIPGYLTMSPANLGRASSIPALTSRHPPLPGDVSNNSERQQSVLIQRKRSSSADASRFLSDEEEAPVDSSQQLQSESTSTLSDCTQINPMTDSDLSSREVEGEMKERLATLPRSTLEELKERPVAVHIRRSSSVPCKTGHNRDSSSSNDSGVSAGSPHFPDLDTRPVCLHSSLPRRCRSSDPLKDMARAQTAIPAKSSSAEAEVPISVQPTKGGGNNQTMTTNGETSTPGVPPCPDSHSTSSGTSDMSDYIETLSLSSHSSSDINDSLRLGGRPATTTLRPRSGREYHNRAFIDTDLKVTERVVVTASLRGLAHYPGVEKCESPSPGYMSGSPGQEREETNSQPR